MTRPLDEARVLVEALTARGASASALPCIERVKRPFPSWPPRAARGTPFVFVTSSFAATCVPWSTLRRAGVQVAALAPKSVETLRLLGVSCAVTAKGGAVALAEALAAQATSRLDVLYPSSDVGQREPEQRAARRILARLGRLTTPVAYETVAPPGLRAGLAKLSRRPLGLVFASPSAVRNFQLARRASKLRPELLAAVCLGRSTSVAWDEGRLQEWPKACCVATVDEVVSEVMKEERR